jgi:hypothetical protein
MELEVVEVAPDRFQILDQRGALVHATASRGEAESFRAGYRLGREDATRIVRGALEELPGRVSLSRT